MRLFPKPPTCSQFSCDDHNNPSQFLVGSQPLSSHSMAYNPPQPALQSPPTGRLLLAQQRPLACTRSPLFGPLVLASEYYNPGGHSSCSTSTSVARLHAVSFSPPAV
ncbi:hypothetical protein GOP47_0028714 [Adiantum capillus-veneris]|nr:hypothetical protein GOP47_0028714 [Adiantum capillus-veneris]